jgi:2-C-methyl-D-erythritol 2,4-cyclodiphosphate synthase
MATVRVGLGYDIHRFADGRALILGGVLFPGETGLDGNSDADVVVHAIIDALLGAAGLGDIGTHFPPDDDQWSGASSIDLLRMTVGLLEEQSLHVVNVDATIVAERPRLAGHIPEVRRALAAALAVEPERVNVKATTNEGLGPVGRAEGIAAMAVALLDESA